MAIRIFLYDMRKANFSVTHQERAIPGQPSADAESSPILRQSFTVAVTNPPVHATPIDLINVAMKSATISRD